MARKCISILYYAYFFGFALGIPTENVSKAITVKNCGTSTIPQKSMAEENSTEGIVGGRIAQHGRYPWIVSFEIAIGEGFEFNCGGSVLNENWIITAAHCIKDDTKPERYQIRLGLHKLSETNAATVQTIKISKMVRHKEFVSVRKGNDIALLKTAQPIDIAGSKGYVNGICLPTSKGDPTGSVKVIGWGDTDDNGKGSNILMEVKLPTVSRKACNKARGQIAETVICAGDNGRSSCFGDSGGPLFQTDNKGVSTLLGIVSGAKKCGDKFGYYTKVSSYLDWIEKNVSN